MSLQISTIMPELAEVEITRLKLLPLVKNRRILDFWTDWPRGLKVMLTKSRAGGEPKRKHAVHRPISVRSDRNGTAGKIRSDADKMRSDIAEREITNISRQGKVLFFELSGATERLMAVHLRMSGRLEIVDHNDKSDQYGQTATISSRRWVHFLWRLSGNKELRFVDPRKFGVVWYGSKNDINRDKYLRTLGRDARAIPYSVFREAVRRRSGAVKAVLLRQDILSGIGNIMADETLWRAKVHPQTRVVDLSKAKLKNLHSALVKTIDDMLNAGGTSLRDWGHPDGKIGGYQDRRKIYGKGGEPCPRCKTKLGKLVVAGRGTTVCPKCQQVRKTQSSPSKADPPLTEKSK